VEWAERKGLEEAALDWQSSAAAALGQRRRAEQFTRRIEELASQNRATEAAAGIIAQAALRSAALGYCGTVKNRVSRALSVERDVVARTRGALALAWCGEAAEAESLNSELAGEYPHNSAVNRIWRPAIRGAISIKKGDAQSTVESLKAARYEAAGEFWPQYLRGLAFLRLQQPDEAAREFRKILDHRGQDPISPLYPLAKLGAARASMLQQDHAQAQRMYAEFLADWKKADSDRPGLAEAKHAVARLSGKGSFAHGSTIQ
jgi:predicted Zn-dependent protease